MPKKQKSVKKGVAVKQNLQIKNIKELIKKNGEIQELRKYENGRYGAFFENGQFRWVSIDNSKTTKCPCNCKTKKCKCGCVKGLCKCNMKGGGKTIDLQTAVKLLRNYYSEKYN